jgi:hypothetical protein
MFNKIDRKLIEKPLITCHKNQIIDNLANLFYIDTKPPSINQSIVAISAHLLTNYTDVYQWLEISAC